jgi:mannose-6-phosphate isomerase-like protein (cupin superfamily)
VTEPTWKHLPLASLRQLAADGEASYAEWLRVPGMSSGLYVLEVGADDPQQPHNEDEVYVVVSGSARFTCAGQTTAVGPGSVIFVPALDEHRFHDVTARLNVVVVVAPAET